MLAKKVVGISRVGFHPTRFIFIRHRFSLILTIIFICVHQCRSVSKFLFYSSLLFSFFALQSFSYADYDDGDGSAEFPFQIAEPNQLIYMSQHPEHWDKHFILTADINLALAEPNSFTTALIAPDTDNSQSWFQGMPFTGIFNGNGHVISNLTIDTEGAGNDYLGLFGRIEGSGTEIKNLGLENIFINGGEDSWYIGGLCGRNNEGSITNCHASGTVTGGNNSDDLGGLCGGNSHDNISNCYSTGSVTIGGDSDFLGGLCGRKSFSGIIDLCYFLDTSGPDNGYGEPLDDPNMRIQDSFVGWDFVGDINGTEDIWQLCIDCYDYPRIAWQFIDPGDFLHPGRVDHYDLFVLTHDWLSIDSRCCDIAPETPDGIVNFLDYSEFTKYWLHE